MEKCYLGLRNFSIIRNHPSLGVGEALDLGIGGGLGLVAENDVRVREDGHHLVLEELDEEGGGQVHAVRLVLLSTLLARLRQSLGLFQPRCESGSALFLEAGSGSGTALGKKFGSNDIVFYSRFLYLQYVLKKILI